MKNLLIAALMCIMFTGCEQTNEPIDNQYVAKIVGFDLNCSTCILSFPKDSLTIKQLLGESQNNYYQTVNLEKDDYTVGQLLRVKVRKPEDSELRACITLYPSYNYENIYVSDYSYYSDFVLNDTISLAYGNCLKDSESQFKICLDTVLSDSRCPIDVNCVWAGEAKARFKYSINNNTPIAIDLRAGVADTLINEYKFSFVDLLPHPLHDKQINPEDYIAKIVIKRKKI